MKTYLKAGPEGEPETDPVKHKSQLELKKAEATTEGDLAVSGDIVLIANIMRDRGYQNFCNLSQAVEAEAAQADTDEAHKLVRRGSKLERRKPFDCV